MKEITGRVRHTHISIELLSAYMDGQVSRADQTRIEGHLTDCSTCSNELRSLRQTSALLSALPRVRVPHAFTLSEAMVGQRQTSRPWRFGGWARGMAAVSAIAIMAVIAVSLLKQPAWTPAELVARVAPSEVASNVTAQLATQEPASTVANTPSMLKAANGEPTAEAAFAQAPAAKALAPSTAPSATQQDETQPSPNASLPLAAAPESASDVEMKDAITEFPADGDASPTAEPGLLAMALAAPAETPAVGAPAFGRGGSDVTAGRTAAELSVADQAPPIAPAASVLDDSTLVVYADAQGLWSIDAERGVRSLATSGRPSLPQISPDGSWVVFLVQNAGQQEVMAVPYQGGETRLVLSEEQLPQADLGPEFDRRRIDSVSWIGREHELSVQVVAFANDGTSLAKMELWNLDVDTGVPTFIMDIGTAGIAAFSPDATTVALLDFGSEQKPDGSLALAHGDGSELRTAIPLTNSYQLPRSNSQLQWLPDGGSLLVAIPDAAHDPTRPAVGFTVFRVSASGQAGSGTHVAGVEPVWAESGARLSYYAHTGESMDSPRTLMIADGDGSNAAPYAEAQMSAWYGWAPNATGFLYAEDDSVFLGIPGQPAHRIGSAMSVVNPKWTRDDQFLSLLDQGQNWALVSRNINGDSATLAELPRDVDYAVAPGTN